MSIRGGSSQTHLAELTGDSSNRILVSVPADGSAALVVSSEGHDQVIDLLTGERQEDDVAAAFYREDRVQEPHHTFPAAVESIPVLYGGDEDSEIAASVSFQATALTLTAWTKEERLGRARSAWLEMDWNCETTIETSVPGLVEEAAFSATASLTVDDKTTTDELHADKLSFSPEQHHGGAHPRRRSPRRDTTRDGQHERGFTVEFDGCGVPTATDPSSAEFTRRS